MKKSKKIQNKEPWEDRHKVVSSLVNKNEIKIAVELGVAFGGNSENLLKNTDIKKLYGVDSYKKRWTYNDGMNIKQSELDTVYKNTLKRLTKFGQQYTHIRKFSKDALNDVPDVLDFIYIDADHSYIGCLNDLRLWIPKVKEGGIIAGDDYNSIPSPGVTKAVDKYFKKLGWEIHTEGPRVWWVKKQSTDTKLSLFNHLFIFNPFIRKFHFFLGEFFNATLGKILFITHHFRRKINPNLRITVKKILPNNTIIYLKKHCGK